MRLRPRRQRHDRTPPAVLRQGRRPLRGQHHVQRGAGTVARVEIGRRRAEAAVRGDTEQVQDRGGAAAAEGGGRRGGR